MSNPFMHMELTSSNADQAKDFYSALFDWKFQETSTINGMRFVAIQTDKGIGGGIIQPDEPAIPTRWTPFILVDSVSDTIAKAEPLGAQIYRAKRILPGMGAFAVLSDPHGAVFGLWENEKKQAPSQS